MAFSRLEGVTVLLVTDMLEMSDALRSELEAQGIHVTIAASAQEALIRFNQMQLDVFIVDTDLPNYDCYTLMRQMKALEFERDTQTSALNKPMPKAIALTTYATTADRNWALRKGFQVRLVKPVDLSELVGTLASLSRYLR